MRTLLAILAVLLALGAVGVLAAFPLQLAPGSVGVAAEEFPVQALPDAQGFSPISDATLTGVDVELRASTSTSATVRVSVSCGGAPVGAGEADVQLTTGPRWYTLPIHDGGELAEGASCSASASATGTPVTVSWGGLVVWGVEAGEPAPPPSSSGPGADPGTSEPTPPGDRDRDGAAEPTADLAGMLAIGVAALLGLAALGAAFFVLFGGD